MIPIRIQHRHLAALQQRWDTDALKDFRYNMNRARQERHAGNRVLARGYTHEAILDADFGRWRAMQALHHKRLGR